jgi:hypothetical protein
VSTVHPWNIAGDATLACANGLCREKIRKCFALTMASHNDYRTDESDIGASTDKPWQPATQRQDKYHRNGARGGGVAIA